MLLDLRLLADRNSIGLDWRARFHMSGLLTSFKDVIFHRKMQLPHAVGNSFTAPESQYEHKKSSKTLWKFVSCLQ